MKKVVFLILLFISCLSVTFAETTNIKTKVSLNGKDLEEGEFSFYLEDNKGNVIKVVKNDKDGVVDFGEIELPEAPEQYQTETNTFYYIVQKNEGIEGYTYDDKKVIVRIKKDFTEEKVDAYYYTIGSLEEEYKSKIPKYEYKEPYHATEEELEGEAYGVFDAETKTLSFVRIKDLDTSNFTYPFGNSGDPDRAVDMVNRKVYYRGGEDSPERLERIITESYSFGTNENIVPTKIEFKEAFKPKFTNLNFVRYSSKRGIFAYGNLANKEVDFSHFDTSNITDMANAFEATKSKKLDLSSFDTSKVTTMSSMFMNSHDIEELDLRSFTFESLESAQYMFHATDNLSVLKISAHTRTDKLKAAYDMFSDTMKLQYMDFSWLMLGPESSAGNIFQRSGIEYLDLSHWDFENPGNSIFSTSFYLPNLKYIDISNLKTPLCGAYSSGDFKFYDNIELIKLSNQFNGIYTMMDKYDTKLFNDETGEYTKVLHGAGRSACEYYPGGNYYNVSREAVLGETIEKFENNYEEPKIETVIVENPNTKDVFVILFSVLVISFSILIIIKEAKVRA